MEQERGSAIAIVLLVLGVLSLIGAGLLTRSKLDMMSATSIQSYDKIFSLADGAAAMGVRDLRSPDLNLGEQWRYPESAYPGPSSLLEGLLAAGTYGLVSSLCGSVPGIGAYETRLTLTSYSGPPPGWPVGEKVYTQYWTVKGTGKRPPPFLWMDPSRYPTSTVEVAVTKVVDR